MPAVKNTTVSTDDCRDSVSAVLRSTLEAVRARYGVVRLSSDDGSLPSPVSYGAPPVCQESLPIIGVPIEVNGVTLGNLQASFPSPAGDAELPGREDYLRLAANLIGSVIVQSRLQRQLQEMRESLRKAYDISLEIQEREREGIILEVHDGIAQTLASAFHYLQTIDNIGSFPEEHARQFFVKALALIRQAIQETREVINSVTPATLDVLGLVTTLRQELKRLEKDTGCRVDFRLDNWPNLPKPTEFAIYRIIREAVTNVRKHARAPKMTVVLGQETGCLAIRVRDWGCGFVPEEQESLLAKQGLGLLSMRRRAEFLGGDFRINSSPGKGTDILIEIPWPREEA